LLDTIRSVLRLGMMLPLRQKTTGATAKKAICYGDGVVVMRPFKSRRAPGYPLGGMTGIAVTGAGGAAFPPPPIAAPRVRVLRQPADPYRTGIF
jgi:hypothetical protein